LNAADRRLPWSLLRARWLDLPIAALDEHAPTWGVFSEDFDRCLRDVSLHVSQRVSDREGLAGVVTKVVVENLDLLVSLLGESEKRDRLLEAADLVIARRAAAQAIRMDARPETEVWRLNRISDT
jgi:hypothetical protein